MGVKQVEQQRLLLFYTEYRDQKGLAWDLATAGDSSRMRDPFIPSFLRSLDLFRPICLLGNILAGTEVPGREVVGGGGDM